ncbi:MAG: DUF2971 domain-containing protein [Bacteroidales bacterium]|nr:DUF2971 domain-containing protein [Bacteroidales bacterium]
MSNISYLNRLDKEHAAKHIAGIFDSKDNLYKFSSYETAVIVLGSMSLKYGPLTQMNDITERDKYVINSSPYNYTRSFFPDEEAERKANDATKTAKNFVSHLCQLCFSVDPSYKKSFNYRMYNCLPLWGNYSKNGEGVCFVFDKNKIKEKIEEQKAKQIFHVDGMIKYDTTNLIKVNSDELSSFIGNEEKCAEYCRRVFFHKSEDWSYENEYRILAERKTDKDLFLNIDGCIKCIIIYRNNHNSVIGDGKYKVLEKLVNGSFPILLYKVEYTDQSCSEQENKLYLPLDDNQSSILVMPYSED